MDKSISYKELLEEARKYLSTKFYPIMDYGYTLKQAKSVIKDHFSKFGKGDKNYNKLLSEIEGIEDVRCAHIVYTFLLGIFLYNDCEIINQAVDKNVSKILKAAGHKDDFPFLWFLICLFHDLGYSKENKQKNSRIGVDWVNNQKKLAAFDGVPELYSKIYRQYFLYRKIEHGKTDHGIYAGLKMYEDLRKIQKEQKKNHQDEDVWRDELVPLYNFASWVVLAHNMYFTKDTQLETCALYKKYSLDDLILDTEGGSIKNYPIKLSEYPVLFLFCLVDLIEPMKRIEKIGCCDEIDFEISDNKVKISSDLDCACVKNYLNEISKAEDWFTTTDFSNKKCVELSLIPQKPRRGSIPVKKNNKH